MAELLISQEIYVSIYIHSTIGKGEPCHCVFTNAEAENIHKTSHRLEGRFTPDVVFGLITIVPEELEEIMLIHSKMATLYILAHTLICYNMQQQQKILSKDLLMNHMTPDVSCAVCPFFKPL